MRFLKTSIFLLAILFSLSGKANESRYVFKQLNNEDGLSYNSVQDIAQESSGIIWFATKQGLNKYDSYHIKKYYYEDNVGLPSNLIQCLLITKNNTLFVGCQKGLVVYDRNYDKFTPLTYDGKALPGVKSLLESKSGVVLIGTIKGIYAYHPDQKTLVKFVSLQNANIRSFCEVASGNIMVATFSGIYFVNSDGVLIKYFNNQNTPTLPTDKITKVYKDRKGYIWIGTYNNGLFLFDEKGFKKIKLSENEATERIVIRDIIEDAEENLWIAGEHGIFVLDYSNQKSINIRRSLERSDYHLNDNATYCLFRSAENIMWIGTYFGGVNYTNLSNQKGFTNIYPGDGEHELRGRAVSRIYKSSKGILWVATEDGGVCTLDPETKKIIEYFQYKPVNGLSSNNIHTICEDKYGRIWFGHYMTGIDIYNPISKKFRNLSLNPDEKFSITGNSVYCIFKDAKQRIWIGNREGVFIYDYETDKLQPFKANEIGINFIYNISEDRSGKMWFSCHHGGIICYNPLNDTLKFYRQSGELSTDQIISSTEDQNGRIWFGTVNGGVNIYHPKTDSFEIITMKEGLPNNTVYGILEAEQDNMWLSTNRGLALYNYETKDFRNYQLSDGLAQLQFNYSSYFKDSDETLYFGHINGLTYFNPKDVSDNNYQPQLIFTDFKLFNESVEIAENGILSNHINKTESISLNYSQKAFTIDFVAINHFSAGNNRFYYFLEGFEEEWNDMGKQTSATYTNLSPGTYTFWLKAENDDGIESANTKSLEIRIKPPFYISVWAYLIYTGLLIGIFLFYKKITIDKEKEKAALNYEKIEKKKIKELSQQRLNFFTYISHEFKTPLSIIISSIDQLSINKDISGEIKLKFERLSRSSKRLSFLFNQLIDFRKIETKHAKLVLQKGDIVGFLRETCLVFAPLFDQQRVNFAFKSNKDYYEYWFDPDKIEKIIVNLISNAIKNTPVHGQVNCELKIIEDTIETNVQNRLEISIGDTGVGISDLEVKNLFTPFYVNYKSGEGKRGSGIGLTLVKSLVEYLHGTIEVKSTLNQGTRFYIQLPINYEKISNIKLESTDTVISRNFDIDSISDIPSKQLKPKDTDIDGKDFKLLIVEDTIDLAEILTEHYSKTFQVSCAQNGIEALKIVKDEEPDIIISDVMMPEMDGIEFCKKIKQDEATSHIAVILLTAKTTHEDKIAGLKVGAEAYVTKPFDLTELDLHVRNFIEIRRRLKEKVVTGAQLDLDKLNFQDRDKDFIEKVSGIINDNIESESLNTEELAQKLGMSKTLVYLKLKKLLNMSGSDYIQSLRFKKAIELMADSNRNIANIAYEVGFSDPNYFSKVFKKVYQKTPTLYRKELLEKLKGLNIN